MANIIKAPDKLPAKKLSLFLAGSIEEGKTIDW